MARRRLLTRNQVDALRSGRRDPEGVCVLPCRLAGSARVAFMNSLDWASHGASTESGSPFGVITETGREALERGWYR